jgi:hypothetical protein
VSHDGDRKHQGGSLALGNTEASTLASRGPRLELRFYLVVSAAFLALVLWTFARTFYLKAFFHTPALPLLLHFHGAVMTGWPVLLAVQAGLVAARRVRWHRRLGAFGVGWAGLVVLLGSITTVHAAVREVRGHTAIAPIQLMITGLDLMQMLFFAAYVVTAIAMRHRSDYHKRFMVLTIACMLPDALARLPVSFMTNTLILAGLDAFVLGVVAIDTLRHRRLHPAFGWGGAAFIVAFHLAFHLMQTPAWVHFGTGLLA